MRIVITIEERMPCARIDLEIASNRYAVEKRVDAIDRNTGILGTVACYNRDIDRGRVNLRDVGMTVPSCTGSKIRAISGAAPKRDDAAHAEARDRSPRLRVTLAQPLHRSEYIRID